MTLLSIDAGEDFGRQLTSLPGWRAFVGASLGEPMAALTKAEYDALEAGGRDAYDDDRLDHHARLQVVATSTVRSTVTCGRQLIVLNRGSISARRGLMVSGPPNTGKTIALTQLGLAHELQDRRRHPGQDDRIPVIYITVPPAATPRMIAAEFARFLGLPVLRSSNITDLTEAVVGVCTKARTGLILVDEIHNISLTTRHGAHFSDTLKYFSERIPATFAYAGIDIEDGSLLSGTRGDQIAARFTSMATHAFPHNAEWKALVAQMEANLVLHEHKRGILTSLDRFIHTRTGGMIGTLSHQAANLFDGLPSEEVPTRRRSSDRPLPYLCEAHADPTRSTPLPVFLALPSHRLPSTAIPADRHSPRGRPRVAASAVHRLRAGPPAQRAPQPSHLFDGMPKHGLPLEEGDPTQAHQ